MIIVKITALLMLATVIYWFLVKSYIKGNRREAVKFVFDSKYAPGYIMALGIMGGLSIIGIFASAIYLLFFR